MTVAELIAELQKHPPETPVVRWTDLDTFSAVETPRIDRMYRTISGTYRKFNVLTGRNMLSVLVIR